MVLKMVLWFSLLNCVMLRNEKNLSIVKRGKLYFKKFLMSITESEVNGSEEIRRYGEAWRSQCRRTC